MAYTDYGSYEGTGWMLMEKDGKLFENHSSHCSCYGNEGQFTPEPTEFKYLQSDKFSIYCYGGQEGVIKNYIKKLNHDKDTLKKPPHRYSYLLNICHLLFKHGTDRREDYIFFR